MAIKSTSGFQLWQIFPLIMVLILAVITGYLWGYRDFAQVASYNQPLLSEKRDFLFRIDNYVTKNQGGQTLTMYFHYRYNPGIATADIPDYRDLRTWVIGYMDNLDVSQNPYWETINKDICTNLKQKFPLEAITCQIVVASDTRTGTPNEPGVHSSIDTIGDIEPLTFAP